MFAKKHTSMFGAFAIDSKASRGRHARVKGRAQSARCAFESSARRAQAFAGQRASRSACRAIEGSAGQVQAIAGQRVSRPLSFDEGMLGDKNAVAYDVRDYLESFGIASFDEVCRLGVTGPYLEDFKRIFAENASFPPAA